MFLVNWFYDVLYYLGLYQKSGKLLFLGLDNAGKTTLLDVLKQGRLAVHEPTLHPNSEELEIGKIKFRTFDLGGHESARKLWKEYFAKVDGVIFLVDAEDKDRFPEARQELSELLSDEELANVPFAVLGNKIDMPGAASEQELRINLNLVDTFGKDVGVIALIDGQNFDNPSGVRPVELFMCSVVKQIGYTDAFNWISKFL